MMTAEIDMPKGTIIFLNGTSSSGKTTLARALQDLLPAPYLHIALDQFRDGMPARFRGLNSPSGTPGAMGLNVVPVVDEQHSYTDIQFGCMGKQMLEGMRRAVACMAQQGNNVIIDDIILVDEFLQDYLTALDSFKVIFVGVRCPIEVINERERQRPGRFPGTAVGHFHSAHAHGIYDIEVDTSIMSPDSCAQTIARFITEGKEPQAFTQLRRNRQN